MGSVWELGVLVCIIKEGKGQEGLEADCLDSALLLQMCVLRNVT